MIDRRYHARGGRGEIIRGASSGVRFSFDHFTCPGLPNCGDLRSRGYLFLEERRRWDWILLRLNRRAPISVTFLAVVIGCEHATDGHAVTAELLGMSTLV